MIRLLPHLLAVGLAVTAAHGESIPETRGTTLSGKELVLPRDLRARHAILVIGFSEKSAETSRDWGKKLDSNLREDPEVEVYQIPVLAAVPGLFRGMALRGMKKEVPSARQDMFFPIFEKEQEWKRTVVFAKPAESYILLVDRRGNIEWKTHGPASGAALEELLRKLESPGVKAGGE